MFLILFLLGFIDRTKATLLEFRAMALQTKKFKIVSNCCCNSCVFHPLL